MSIEMLKVTEHNNRTNSRIQRAKVSVYICGPSMSDKDLGFYRSLTENGVTVRVVTGPAYGGQVRDELRKVIGIHERPVYPEDNFLIVDDRLVQRIVDIKPNGSIVVETIEDDPTLARSYLSAFDRECMRVEQTDERFLTNPWAAAISPYVQGQYLLIADGDMYVESGPSGARRFETYYRAHNPDAKIVRTARRDFQTLWETLK